MTIDRTRLRFLAGASVLGLGAGLALGAPAAAQTSQPAAPATAVEEVVVTGSRLQTSTFQTPTPVTATSAEDLKAAAPRNIADALTELPAFNNNTRSETPATAATGGTNGQNLLNLRGLGPARNLVLLDGRRLPATNSAGSVDVNVLPQSLVQRVDVVTGGASAAYGSDAVAGVVNFVLNTHFEGLKGEVQGGASTYADLPSGQASLAWGRSFFDGRGHLIASAEIAAQKGLDADETTGRYWFDHPAGQIPNPFGSPPKVIVIPDIRNRLGANGGLITTGPLAGMRFLPGGQLAPFNPGNVVGSTFASGGDGAKINIAFSPDQLRSNAFLHGEFEVDEHLTLFAEGMYAYSHVTSGNYINPHTGTSNQFTIFNDNAFLPAPVRQALTTAGVTSFKMGRYESDFPLVEIETITDVERVVLGGRGAIAGSWRYDAYYTYGQTNQELRENNLSINRNLYAAVDAVRDPATGNIVCRSTLSGYDPGCAPLNLFGEGAPSQAAIDFVLGDSVKYLTIKQTVAAVNVNGDLGDRLQLGAGPIAVAAGLEYRKESADQTVDPLSPLTTDFTGVRGFPPSQQGRPGAFNFFNPLPLAGSYDIKEGYLEAGLPVLRDAPFARNLDINGAVRRAEYSQSGGVTTWKYGVNWEINDSVRLRFTKSQDIRGPNILELFNSATQNSNNQIYQGRTTQTLTINSGNPDLKPEKAITLTYGVVLRPAWIPGLQMSLDYYDIAITDAIGSLSAQQTIDQCAAGNQLLCQQITVTPQNTLIVLTHGLNLNIQKATGYDFEAAYSTQLADGRLSLRLLANHQTEAYVQAPGSAPTINLGEPTSPDWRASLQARYVRGPWSLFLQERYISESKFDASKAEGVDTNDNTAPPIAYTDLSASYRFGWMGEDQEAFVSVSNLLNQKPPVSTSNPTTFSTPSNAAYDRIGRYFTAGLRFRF